MSHPPESNENAAKAATVNLAALRRATEVITANGEKSFDVALSIGGVLVRYRADPVSYDTCPPEGWADYFLTPEVDGRTVETKEEGVDESEIRRVSCLQNDKCEVDDVDTNMEYYVSRGALRSLCAEHADGIPVRFERLRVPKPAAFERLMAQSHELNDRQKVHTLMVEMERKGMTRAKISEELQRQGYIEVSRRTVDKHLRRECVCFPREGSV